MRGHPGHQYVPHRKMGLKADNYPRNLLSKAGSPHGAAPKTEVDHAGRGRRPRVITNFLGFHRLILRAIIEIWTIPWIDRRLASWEQEERPCRHASRANTSADLHACIVGRVSIEIPTVAILIWLS